MGKKVSMAAKKAVSRARQSVTTTTTTTTTNTTERTTTTRSRTRRVINVAAYTRVVNGKTQTVAGYSYTRA